MGSVSSEPVSASWLRTAEYSRQHHRHVIWITSYNIGPYIERALSSALAQEHEDFILVVFDDASTDKTVEVIRRVQKENPSRVFLFEPYENTHLSGQKNIRWSCLERFDFDYLSILDGDDYWLSPSKLTQAEKALENNQVSFTYHKMLQQGAFSEDPREYRRLVFLANTRLAQIPALRSFSPIYAPTSSLTLRRRDFPFRFMKSLDGNRPSDAVIKAILRTSGKGSQLEDVLGVYTVGRQSQFASKTAITKMVISVRLVPDISRAVGFRPVLGFLISGLTVMALSVISEKASFPRL